MRFGLICLAAAILAAAPPPPAIAASATPATFDKLQRADGVQVVPERFLRRWDPVTVFLDRDAGPAGGGPEDHPEKFATIAPAPAGAWQWLGPRVLQFRPAEPWQPLRRVTVIALGHATTLVPLLPTPVDTSPADEPDGIVDLDAVRLTFTDPIDESALARLLTIELRPQPGFATGEAQQLTAQDFTIKALERALPTDRQTYAVTLHRPLPDGYVAILRLRLSDEPGLDDPSFELSLRSATPFTVTDISCGGRFTHDTQDGVLRCTPPDPEDGKPVSAGPRELRLRFSAKPEELDIVHARNALRVTPPVDDLAVTREKKQKAYRITGRFLPDTVYELQVAPGSLKDARGRALSGAALSSRFAFLADRPALRWDASQGIAERLGPQRVPLRGRGYNRADIRIYRIDPAGRDFWPFPHSGIETEDDTTPPLAGNEPPPWSGPDEIRRRAIAARIAALGSPSVSELVDLPIARGGVEAKFGLDLKPLFQKIAGADQPGAYLVGLRTLDGNKRRWVRVQVTDLTLSTVEEADRVHFTVTSLANAQPIGGAEIRLEGVRDDTFMTLVRGLTGADGGFTWTAQEIPRVALRRIVVTKGTDALVLDPGRGPQQFEAENWSQPGEPWLGWVFDQIGERREKPRILCHVFTERPIYRPEEPVEISGFVRRYQRGGLSYASEPGTIVINGPGDQEWRLPVTLDGVGGFYQRWDQKTEATGDYSLRFEPKDGDSCGALSFKKEAYKLPAFEVLLNGPQQVPLDGQFSVGLVARYFAGGLVADRPIKWRVTQFPYEWSPPGREGFLFSSDARFSGERNFRSTPVLERDAKSDAGGAAQLTLDPTIEPTAQPRRYVVEATVTGDDDTQIRSTQHVVAVPPFVLGMKVRRYLPQAGAIEPDILAADADGKPLPGIAMTVRLIHRNWNSVLQASDFSQGSAKYVTQVIDETVEERAVVSADDVQHLHFDAREAGVYIVELEASDRIGRKQTLRVDLFMGGDTPVTWAAPPAQTVAVSTDKDAYAPGESATLLIQSPFQTARALAIVEEPEGRFRYDWVDVANGFGRYAVPIRKPQMPRLAVHFLVMRGRLPGTGSAPAAPFDQGKPVTLAATKWVTVTPVQHRVEVTLESPQSARPGQEIEVVLKLAGADKRPLAGTAVFWMVDQAVLSLAKEQPLDPLPQFIVNRPTHMAARDTRNMAFGRIPLEEAPGGEEAVEEWGVENISVRRNFTPVPIYLPHVVVGPDGLARIRVKLPDTLTVYKLRAKAVSGPDRFGFGTGELRVRQPVVATPALPRFVRPGDQFDAGLIGRIVEGPDGAGRAALNADNLTIEGAKEQNLTWADKRPARVDFRVHVPDPQPGHATARLRFLLQRNADKAGDAVEIGLPIRPDRPPVRTHHLADLMPGQTIEQPPPSEKLRPNSFAASVTLATDPALVRLIGGLDYLLRYPYGCTEQRISLAASELALRPFAPLLTMTGLTDRLPADVKATSRAIEQAIDDDGLVAFWPRGKGSVSLTAWAYRFLIAADKAGQPVDKALADRLATVLAQTLRSDYPRLLAGEQLRERVAALSALADGGKATEAYVAELSRRAALMPVESLAQAAEIVAQLPNPNTQMQRMLLDALWGRVKTLSRDSRLVYAGLAETGGNALILPSETRSVAEVTQAVALTSPDEPRLSMLRDGLIGLGAGDGWGSTNANAAALRALAASWTAPSGSVPVAVAFGDQPQTATLDHDRPLERWTSDRAVALRLENHGGAAITALSDTSYVPAERGSAATPVERGLVLSRQLFRVAAQGPMQRLAADAGGAIRLTVGEVVEETAELVNPEGRTHIALRLPLAAGFEPLNPNIATAPAEATPSAPPSLAPSFVSFGDDEVRYFWDELPAGTYQVHFRMRALVPGSFTSPPGEAETMKRSNLGPPNLPAGDCFVAALLAMTAKRINRLNHNTSMSAARRVWRRALCLGAALGATATAGVFLLQVVERAHLEAPAPTPILYDRHGAFLAQLGHEADSPDGARRIAYGYWIAAPPPERIVRATLALEDRRFWQHPGVDPIAVARALWQDLESGSRRSGASTIAMQIARMQHPAPRTLWAKASEAATALLLTARYGRDALLAHYLRLAPYGNGSHGIAHAARWYFDKPLADLSWAEIALLAAIPQAPGAMNPLRPSGRARAVRRSYRVLQALARQQVIDGEEYAAATSDLDRIRLQRPPRRPDAVHAILRIAGMLSAEERQAVDPADPRIRTTLDLAVQASASRLSRQHLRAWQSAGPQQVAVIVLRRQTREVVAAVGSAAYGGEAGGAVDFTRVSRSPGSTLKPFIFALALQSGRLTPADIMEDLPEGAAGISNADRNFLGPLLPRQALANSRNVPAANLLRKVGLDTGFEFFRDVGLHRLDGAARDFGLSMAIGSLPTSLDRLLRAYGVLADEGLLRPLVWFDGQPASTSRRLLPADVARQVTLFLSDPLARLPSFPRYGTTEFPFAVALKTGTSQGYRDAWTIAWSHDYMIGVWFGRADAGPMRDVSGARVAAGLAKSLLLRLHGARPGDLSDTGFAPPAGHVPVELCVFTGRHSPSGCSQTLVEWLPAKAVPAPTLPTPTPISADATEPAHLSIASPEQNAHLWRNPEAPPRLNRLALRASVQPDVGQPPVGQPHPGQIVWYVDGEPFAVAGPDQTVYWPMLPGNHRFQIRRPFDAAVSKAVRIAVE